MSFWQPKNGKSSKEVRNSCGTITIETQEIGVLINYEEYLKGNTPAKTRLYRMAISTAHDEISQTFHIYGLNEANDKLIPTPFMKDQEYLGFLFKRKEIDDEVID